MADAFFVGNKKGIHCTPVFFYQGVNKQTSTSHIKYRHTH